MSTEEQATAYLAEAELTLAAAKTIVETTGERQRLWAQVVKNRVGSP